ncbi:Phosphomevalonate kinase [Rhizodiscina lignyota]|uniref:Phosphomevalonate kinase n=1 Tax=Rhizodiscina lignyota TaxID=1504668 RepID=A0A9P4I461_9PEZI|nr:Phosphomevalonate kinase [Rhizodiscina lignyota]
MALSPTRTVVSSPGKVLLCGGFLVLDRAYTGLTFGIDARIHVVVNDIPTAPGVTLSEIIVKSPQFRDAVWEYSYRQTEEDGGIHLTQLRAAASQRISRNLFVEAALGYVLTYVSTIQPARIQPASVTILADNDYYSAPSDIPCAAGSSNPPKFADFGTPLNKTNKTGLGSSAALVTAFTAALLVHYLPIEEFSLSNDQGKSILHNLAQAAHCAAQGKVGSGFDVASAVYGSCLYRRFSPSILQHHGEPASPGFAKQLKTLVEDTDPKYKWDTEIIKSAVTVPKGIRLVMCDVDCGSETPGMVKKVLAWRSANYEDAERIWKQLQKHNEELAAELVRLGQDQDDNYSALREIIFKARALIREMSQKSDVPIEPPAQTKLLDDCSNVPGVIGGVVPGAGGFDAIALLIEDRAEVLSGLRDYLQDRQADSSSSGQQVGKVNILGVREEMEGVRIEDVSMYAQWT